MISVYHNTKTSLICASELQHTPNSLCLYSKFYSLLYFVNLGSKISLRCMPYFYLAGFQKCGTSDLYLRILRHPDIEDSSGVKEPHFWKRDLTFENYTQLFQHGASKIVHRAGGMLDLLQKTPRNTPINMHQTNYQFEENSYASIVQGDFSATTIRIPPEKIRALYNMFPYVKIIVMMRDPIDRALSHYLMDIKYGTLKGQPTAKAFHEYCKNLIECINLKTRDIELDLDKTHCKGDWVLTLGIYQFYIKRWLDIVPRENMHFIQFEDYIKQPSNTIQSGIVPFLGLNKLKSDDVQFIDNHFVNNPGIHKVRMLRETRRMLQDFYRPHNRWLSDLVGDKKFTWSLI